MVRLASLVSLGDIRGVRRLTRCDGTVVPFKGGRLVSLLWRLSSVSPHWVWPGLRPGQTRADGWETHGLSRGAEGRSQPGFYGGETELTTYGKRGGHAPSPANCHPENTRPAVPDLSEFQEEPDIWVFM